MRSSIISAFQSACQSGQHPNLSDFVPGEGPARLEVLGELLPLDLVFRGQRGLPIVLDDYLKLFPELAGREELLAEVVRYECDYRRRHGEDVTPADYLSRFPALVTLLESRGHTPPTDPFETLRSPSPTRRTAEIPGYQILGTLGEGGMGIVYRALDRKLNRIVALKQVRTGADASIDEVSRFKREAEVVARLQHPHIVQIFEIGETDGMPWFSLELCPGGSLAAKMATGPMPPREAARLVETLARAMEVAHYKHIVHRDLKPHNVLFGEAGEPKVSDFGLAKKLDASEHQTRTGDIVGTPAYMAPEQAGGKGHKIGPAADVYSLGAILYCTMTGRPPFLAATTLETMVQVLSEEPLSPRLLNPRVPRDLETICLKCLEKAPSRRYLSAEALADDLRRFQNDEPIAARPVSRAERVVRWSRRYPWKAGVAAAVAALLLVAVGGGWWLAREHGLRLNEAERAAIEKSDRESRIQEALSDARNRLRGREWKEAEQQDRRARGLSDAGAVDDDLREQVGQMDRMVQAVFRLEDSRVQRCGMPRCIFNYEKAPPDAAFLALGIDILHAPPAEAARLIRESLVAEELVSALDDWCWVLREFDTSRRAALMPRLSEVARLADPDPNRNQLRLALTQPDSALKSAAEKLLPAALDGKPPPTYLLLLANALAKVGEVNKAITLLHQADQRYPSNFWINLRLAELYNDDRVRKWDRAVEQYRITRALRPDNYIVLNNLAVACMHVKDYDSAQRFLEDAARLRPDDVRGQHHLGIFYSEVKQFNKAVAAYEQVLKLDPDYVPSLLNLGGLLSQRGDKVRAGTLLARGVELARAKLRDHAGDPDEEANLALGLIMLGVHRLRTQQFAAALELFREGVKFAEPPARAYPGNTRFQKALTGNLVLLGQTHLILQQNDQAVAPLEKAIPLLEKEAKVGDESSKEQMTMVRGWLAQIKKS